MSEDVIHVLVELTENKLFVAVVPVLLGAGLFAWWFKVRDRRIAIRDESLKFVNETADLLNKAISLFFGVVRRRSVDGLKFVDKGIGQLFEHRLSTRARSEALLQSPEFWIEYDAITWDLADAVDGIRGRWKSLHTPEALSNANAAVISIDWEASLSTANDIWIASAGLIAAGIDRVLRGTRPRFAERPAGPPEAMRLRNN